MCTGSKFKSGLYFCADEKHKGVPLVDGWQLTSDSISIHLGALVAWSPPPEVHSLQLAVGTRSGNWTSPYFRAKVPSQARLTVDVHVYIL